MNREEALALARPGRESPDITDVVGRMKGLLDFFESDKEYRGLAPFLYTYLTITRAVAERKNKFNDPEALQRLDIKFASLYFEPVAEFLASGTAVEPWHGYFSYCTGADQGAPFAQVLLGINSHINGDLGRAMAQAGYDNRDDFLLINEILREKIPAVMFYLAAKKRDPFGAGALVMRRYIERWFREIIVSWRERAWRDAEAWRSGEAQSVILETERLAGRITKVFDRKFYEYPKIPGELEGFRER